MIGDDAESERLVDLAAAQRMQRRAPERPAEIGANSDAPDNVEHQHQHGADVVPGELAAHRADLAIGVGRVDLMDEAREQPLRVVGVGDAAPPGLDHLVVRAQEAHIAFEPGVVGDQAAVAMQAVP